MPTKGTKRGRTIVVGDVHGCRDEAERLLDLVQFGAGDDLYFLGDLLSRGPDPEGVLALVRRTGAKSVRGNHDDALLRWHAAQRAGDSEAPIKGSQKRIAEQLDENDWDLMESLPLYLDLAEHDLRLVHAGVVPGVAIDAQPVEALLSMRYLGPNNEPIEKGGSVLWGTRYEGPPHVVFGHNAQPEPQLHAWATGIDTAAVYGGKLTALVLERGEPVPPLGDRPRALFSVPSAGRYFTPPAR
jgi:Calcineurin-like phosphoesterase